MTRLAANSPAISTETGKSIGTPARAAVFPEAPASIPHDYAVPPGELIRQELEARGLSQAELAARTGLSTKHVNQVVKAVAPLSIDTALKIERAIGLPAQLLMTIEARYQSRQGKEAARHRLGAFQTWFNRFPTADLIGRGVIEARASLDIQIEQLLSFFGVADPDAYERVYSEAAMSFRRSQHLEVDRDATALWLRLGERQAEVTEVSNFNREKFLALVPKLPSLTRLPIKEAFPQLRSRCAEVGVALAYEPDVTGTRAYAATRWVGSGRPVVILSGRGKYEDGLWFHFFHECAHIILHPKRRSFVHLTEDGDDGDGAETEANEFARTVLLRSRADEVIRQVETKAEAIASAKELEIDPGIVAGQAAYALGPAGFKRFSGLRRKIQM